MNEEKLRATLNQLQKETEGMTDEEKETLFREYFMSHVSTGVIGDVKLKRGKYSVCIKKLIRMGIPEVDAKIICGSQLLGDIGSEEERFDPPSSQLLSMLDEDEIIEDVEPSSECISAKISIFHEEHPEWSHDQVVAAAHGWCRSHKNIKDAALIGGIKQQKSSRETGRFAGISMRKFATLVRLIKSKKSLKIGHAGTLPFKIELPMKNLNRLQTKLERFITSEASWLTSEQFQQRSQYATFIKKRDAMTDEEKEEFDKKFTEQLEEDIKLILGLSEDKTPDEKEEVILDYLTPMELRNTIWVDSVVEFGKPNFGLNNIIKAPVILAKEMVQEYHFRNADGSTRIEKHFKDYNELKKAVAGIDRLYMIVEHKDSWLYGDTIGCVRQIIADDKLRCIRGMGYFTANSLPVPLKDALDNGLTFGVSIGFMAELGEGGNFNGEIYDYIQKNIQLDHLAICVDSTPRCPIEECGINVKKDEYTDNTEFTLIKKNEYYYNIKSIILDNKETIKNKNQEEILGDIMQEDGFKDPKSGKVIGPEPEDQEQMLTLLRKWLAGVTDPDVKSSIKDQIIKLFGDNIEMVDNKEFETVLALKDTQIDSMQKMLKKILKREVLSFTDKYSDADLDVMSLEKLEVLSEVVSDPKIRKDVKAEIIPIAGEDAEEEEVSEDPMRKPERIDPKSIFLDTNKGFMLDAFLGVNFGEERK